MKIGPYSIELIETGYVSLDGGAMFGVVPKTLWSRTNPSDDLNRILLAMRLLLIRYENKIIVTDTGVGNKLNEKLSKIYNVDHQKYNLLNSLKAHNINPEDVTDVIITHLHFDHIGGATWMDSHGELRLTFPNALHHVQKKHWEWALNPSEKDGASFMKENYVPIKDENRLNLLDGPGELFPGLSLLVVNGHTPSMQMIKISDRKETLLYCTDLVPMSSHIPLPYIMGYDVKPLTTLAEKKEILPLAAEQDWTLVFEHDPYVKACKVEITDKGFKPGTKVNID
ncbi:MAG: MBL fold metallo-hydrolase [Calditrichae bacterium]|nr:MBL fold metallo-hydrolase [Calditrichia bacterium]